MKRWQTTVRTRIPLSKNQLNHAGQKIEADKINFFCSFNIWAIFAPRKQNG
jgi:hypothetical protein